MQNLTLKYRTWYNGVAPSPIKLDIPGWAGLPNKHTNGDKPMPWHCIPFVEGSTYGLELYYPFEGECVVSLDENGNVKFEGDFSEDAKNVSNISFPPFLSFSPGHFGMTSAVDIQAPDGYILRTEPHPRYYTDDTGVVPCCVPGHLQTEWWPKIFFVVFKNPIKGQKIIFKKNEPYGQILVLPKKVNYEVVKMSYQEMTDRNELDNKIEKYHKKFVKNDWVDHKGNNFNDKYKVLSGVFSKSGMQGVLSFLDKFSNNSIKKISKKLIKKENMKSFKIKKNNNGQKSYIVGESKSSFDKPHIPLKLILKVTKINYQKEDSKIQPAEVLNFESPDVQLMMNLLNIRK